MTEHRRITIRRPTARAREVAAAPTFTLNRPLKGLRVGLRHEGAWRSWLLISGVWAEWLERDGAIPVVLEVGERTGEEGIKTNADVDRWAGEVDCAIVGLGT